MRSGDPFTLDAIESSSCASFSPFGETVETSAAKPRAGAAMRAAAKMSMRINGTMASLLGEMKACPILTRWSRRASVAVIPFSREREKGAAQRPDEGV
jgi:hypothetical protein